MAWISWWRKRLKKSLTRPLKSIRAQGNLFPTSVSWLMATFSPAEYVRLLLGLLAEGGRATLANGDQATVPADAYSYDAAEQAANVPAFLRRSWSERLFQSSMMSYSRPGMSYANIQDVFFRQAGRTDHGGATAHAARSAQPHLPDSDWQRRDLVSNIGTRLQQPSLPILTQMVWGRRRTWDRMRWSACGRIPAM